MPKPEKVVIVNATPIIALSLIGELDLLRKLYVKVLTPSAVEAEVLAGGTKGIGIVEIRGADWLQVKTLKDPRRADLLSDLDRGEAEVLALAQELNVDLVIIDERLARRHAKRLGLMLTGTLGILLRAKENGLVPVVAPLIKVLQENGIRLSERVVSEALRLAGEI